MNKKRNDLFIGLVLLLLMVILAGRLAVYHIPSHAEQNDKYPDIFPDYMGIVVPVNIAPLNFKVNERAKSYRVVFSNTEGKKIVMRSDNGKISIPPRKVEKVS